jgi:hypothetical protein
MGGAEPAFGAPADEIMAFFLARDETLFNWGGYLSLLSFIALLWFLGALWAAMRRAEGDPALLSMVAFGSGLVGVAALTGGTWAMAVFRIREGLDPQACRCFRRSHYSTDNHFWLPCPLSCFFALSLTVNFNRPGASGWQSFRSCCSRHSSSRHLIPCQRRVASWIGWSYYSGFLCFLAPSTRK